jgi:hypothetical protein
MTIDTLIKKLKIGRELKWNSKILLLSNDWLKELLAKDLIDSGGSWFIISLI